ncbi:caspase domain-containing protein [Mucilaginibacter sp. AW1-7]|uniref:caspase family protein n=1 Tax=Mucilaginibacter sp. AW1-7 TaxID=3349874 RepID=UPI003F735E1C
MSGKRFAILIGINDYHRAPLRFSVNDVSLIRSKLISNCSFEPDDIFSISSTVDKPIENVQELLEKVFNNLRDVVQPNDSILFYFSGHGKVIDEFLLEFHDIDVSLSSVQTKIDALNNKNQFFIIDACHAGGAEVKGEEIEAINQFYRDKIAQRTGGLQILCSCSKNQISLARPELQNGVYTHYLAKAIDNAALYDIDYRSLSLNQIHEYAVKQLEISKEEQIPFLITRMAGYFPFAHLTVNTKFSKQLQITEIFEENDIYAFMQNQALQLPEEFGRDFAQLFAELSMNLFTHNHSKKISISFQETTIEIQDHSPASFNPFTATPTEMGMGIKVYQVFLEKYEGKVMTYYQSGNPNIIRFVFAPSVFSDLPLSPCHIYISGMLLGSTTPINKYDLPTSCEELIIDVSKSITPLSLYPKLIQNLLSRTESSKPLIIIKMHHDDMLRRKVSSMIHQQHQSRILLL